MTTSAICPVLGIEMDQRHMTMTEDGQWVSADIYRESAFSLRCGALTVAQIKQHRADEKTFLKEVHTHIAYIRKASEATGESITGLITQFATEERRIAEEQYKKFARTVTKQEHIEIMQQVRKSLAYDIAGVTLVDRDEHYNTERQVLTDEYLKGRSHMETQFHAQAKKGATRL